MPIERSWAARRSLNSLTILPSGPPLRRFDVKTLCDSNQHRQTMPTAAGEAFVAFESIPVEGSKQASQPRIKFPFALIRNWRFFSEVLH